MMKRFVSIVILLSFMIALCGCAKSERVILSNSVVEVVRSGRQIRVTDAETGAQCVYAFTRKRSGTGEAVHENRVGNLSVKTGCCVMIITGKTDSWIIRFGRL